LAERTAALGQDVGGLERGIVLGDTGGIGEDLSAALKATSLTHITAVSGAHVAIVLGTVLGLAALAGLRRTTRGVLGGAVLLGFVALVGPAPSVLRATLMGGVGLIALVGGRLRAALGALGAALLVLLILDPFLARSFGLTLSVASTAALILVAPALERRLRAHLPKRLAQAVALTAAAQLVCAPIVVIFAGTVPLAGVPANVLAVPALPLVTVAGLGACLLGPLAGLPGLGWVSLVADVAAHASGAGAWWIARVALWVAGWPGAVMAWPDGVIGACKLAAALLLAALAWWAGKRAPPRARRWLSLGLALAVVVAGPWAGPFRRVIRLGVGGASQDWVAAVCDVGQGTAVALRSGDQAAVLVDAGPVDGGVAACLDRLGVARLDAVVLTHFHADHAGGVAQAAAGRAVGWYVHPDPCGETTAAGRAAAAMAGAGAAERVITSLDGPVTATAGDLSLTLLPSVLDTACANAAISDSAVNDAGLVVLAQAGGVNWWALGDLETAGQDSLLGATRRLAEPVSGGVVVAAHHGSARQSAALAQALAPAVAVFSAGAGNSYGHPSDRAMELYAATGAALCRTDQAGTVIFSLDPDGALTTNVAC
jgi:competence protein ComEC